jgi:hypothetical protein
MSVRFAAAFIALFLPVTANAQGLAHLVPDLILDGITLPGGAGPGNPHNGHFTLGDPTTGGSQAASRADTAAIAAVENFNGSFIRQLTNVPLGSSTGGFTFNFDEKTGTYTRGSNSFGPSFTERANTIGHKKLSAGFTYQHSSFDSFGGLDLNDGSINFYLPHTDCCNAASPPPSPNVPGLEGDLMDASLQLKATADTFAFMANYGLTPHFDIGVAVPITRVDLDATVNATIVRLSTVATPLVHTFVEGQDEIHKTFNSSGSASGIGDIIVRGKYAFHKEGNVAAAAGVDLRLPTGDAEELLGLGATQAKVYGITSFSGSRVSTHLNFGYTFSTAGSEDFVLGASDEFNYTGAVEYLAHPRLTLLADFLGRTFKDAGTVAAETKQYVYRPGAGADATVPTLVSQNNPVTNQPYRELALTPGNLHVLLGALGGKFNLSPNLLLSGNVLFPLANNGLKDRLTIAFGLDYAF